MDNTFDLVITVCDNAKETCPYFPKAKERIHSNFEDPSAFEGTDDDKLKELKIVRDEIHKMLKLILQ